MYLLVYEQSLRLTRDSITTIMTMVDVTLDYEINVCRNHHLYGDCIVYDSTVLVKLLFNGPSCNIIKPGIFIRYKSIIFS